MRKRFKSWAGGLAAGLLLVGMLQWPTHADAAAQQRVRVAMFLDLGSTYRSTSPAITLKSAGELSIGPKADSGFISWVQVPAGEAVRFSVDSYRVKAMETTSFDTAAAAAKKLQATAHKPIVFVDKSSAGITYEVYTGMYASEASAQAAATAVAKTLSGQLGTQKPEVRGGLYLAAATSVSKADADGIRSQIEALGYDAWIVMTGGGGDKPSYNVWVGEASSSTQLAATKSGLQQKMPQLQLTPVNASAPALILRSDATNNLNSPVALDHYMLSGDNAKLWVQGDATNPATLTERSARKYRGDFEISLVNGQLALVNELPLEQYLYSVVGGEVSSSWPLEALKAQAVAARSYALFPNETKFKIAGLVDTTLSQVYSGVSTEAPSIIQAVDETADEVLKSNGKLIEGIFGSNSGGMTADPSEVWKSVNTTYAAVESKEDVAAVKGLKKWLHIQLASGQTGYVREDNAKLTGDATAAGLKYMTVTASKTNVRPIPMVQSSVNPVATMNPGDKAVVLETVDESNSYSWIRGPYSSAELLKLLKGKITGSLPTSITSLEVTGRGPSGRATEIQANGQVLSVKYPDLFRSAFGGLPSTRFDIVETGRYTVQGANGQRTLDSGSGAVLSASGKTTVSGNLVIMNGQQKARALSDANTFLFAGQGNGHGMGLSQWGAKGMADAGYDYIAILQHYYQNVTITKD
ncbi:sporulation protein [Paenibacillus sp. CAA11]|nr:sporulation protein [Paenibacillus sp. CAA11]